MEIRVYANAETFNACKPLYVRRIVGNGAVDTPFNLLLRSMHVLYGNSVIVVFINDPE